MATYDVQALRNIAPNGVRGGGRGRGSSRALDHFWVDKVTINVDTLNAGLDTALAADDIITFGEVTRDQVLMQGVLRIHTASAAAATLDLGHSGDRDAFLDGASIATATTYGLVGATETPILVAKPSSGTRTITLELKTGTGAGAEFMVWWAWFDVDVDEHLYGV